MLRLVEDRREIRKVQTKLRTVIKANWPRKEMRLVAWRPDSANLLIHHNQSLWFGGRELIDQKVPRFWNAFGKYKSSGNLQIDVEINVPTKGNSKRVAGFFARDALGRYCIMHDGSVGGGRTGIGREQFLWWLSMKSEHPILVESSRGETRLGLLVAVLDTGNAGRRVYEFVQRAIDFKEDVKSGLFQRSETRRSLAEFRSYFKEFTGPKRRAALPEAEYVTRHGDIVEALRKWRPIEPGEREVKSALIDWGVIRDGRLREVYEVKTGCDRQALYTAIGQLLVHTGSRDCKKVMVLPVNNPIPQDISNALAELAITVLRYKLNSQSARVMSDGNL